MTTAHQCKPFEAMIYKINQINAHGLHSLSKGRMDEAKTLFKVGVKHARDCLGMATDNQQTRRRSSQRSHSSFTESTPDDQSLKMEDNDATMLADVRVPANENSFSPVPSPCHESTEEIFFFHTPTCVPTMPLLPARTTSTGQESPFVYNRAFTISPESLQDPQQAIESISVYLLFNLALSFHFEGLLVSRSSLKKALSCYNMIAVLASSATPSRLPGRAGLMAIILSNMCEIHYRLGNYQELRTCLRQLCQTLEGNREEARTFIVEESEYQEILLNILTLREPTIAGAA